MGTICIFGKTTDLFGTVVNSQLSLSDTDSNVINNNLCWLIEESMKGMQLFIIGTKEVCDYYKVIFNWIGETLQKSISWQSVDIDNLSTIIELDNKTYKQTVDALNETVGFVKAFTASKNKELIEYELRGSFEDF